MCPVAESYCMDGIHDVGGMDGFGSLSIGRDDDGDNSDTDNDSDTDGDSGINDGDGSTDDEYDPFHEQWEEVTYSLFVATLGNGIANIDEFRHSIERMDPDRYLAASYYDRWVTGLSRLLLETDTIDFEDFQARTEAFDTGEGTLPERTEPGLVDELAAGVADAYGGEGTVRDPRFEAGETVRVRNHYPKGHTRCPRYVRRARGTVEAHRGAPVLPDANAHGDPVTEPLYEVAFTAQELWGEAGDPNVTVTLDLWESYLAPATAESSDTPDDDAEDVGDTDDFERADAHRRA